MGNTPALIPEREVADEDMKVAWRWALDMKNDQTIATIFRGPCFMLRQQGSKGMNFFA